MSSTPAFYFLLHETLSNEKYSWKREYLKLSATRRGKLRLESVVEYESKVMYRPAYPKLGLPWGVVASTRAEYAAALLRFRKAEAIRQQQLNLEKEYFEKAQKVLTLRQLAQLYQAERDFTKEVLQRVAGQGDALPGKG